MESLPKLLARLKFQLRESLSTGVLETWTSWRRAQLRARFKKLPIAEAFDEIYKSHLWGNGDSPSGQGSYGLFAERYVDYAARFIISNSISSLVDVGCGDFNVGSQLAPLVKTYLGLDVSAEIVNRNAKAFLQVRNARFERHDACEKPIPPADLVTIRQVLQHLTNAQIERVLRNVEASGCRFAIIAEHCVPIENMSRPNVDLASHGPFTRVDDRSGVVVHEPPFSRPARIVETISSPEYPGEVLYVFVWEFSER